MTKCKECCWWSPNRVDIVTDKEKLCLHPKINIVTDDDFGCTEAVPPSDTEVNVPNHTPNGMQFRNENPVDGPVEILIVTYSKDFPWLSYALRSIQKHLKGFQGTTVAYPSQEHSLFSTLTEQFNVRLYSYDEVRDKGMVQHMAKMAKADTFLPAGTKYVLHADADCIFKMPTTPEDYFFNDKPYYLIRPWSSLTTEDPRNPGSKVVSDCLQWREPTANQLGFDSEWYTMCMNTCVMPIGFYAPYRNHISAVQGMDFERFMLLGRNKWPQDRMDFTAMGAWAKRFMPDAFTWFDVSTGTYPEDRKKAYHSHSGFTPAIRAEIEGFLS